MKKDVADYDCLAMLSSMLTVYICCVISWRNCTYVDIQLAYVPLKLTLHNYIVIEWMALAR